MTNLATIAAENLIFYWFILLFSGIILISLFLGRKKVGAFLKLLWTKFWVRTIFKIIFVFLIVIAILGGLYSIRDKIITSYRTDPQFCILIFDCALNKTDCSWGGTLKPVNVFNRIHSNCPAGKKISDYARTPEDFMFKRVKCEQNRCIMYSGF